MGESVLAGIVEETYRVPAEYEGMTSIEERRMHKQVPKTV